MGHQSLWRAQVLPGVADVCMLRAISARLHPDLSRISDHNVSECFPSSTQCHCYSCTVHRAPLLIGGTNINQNSEIPYRIHWIET